MERIRNIIKNLYAFAKRKKKLFTILGIILVVIAIITGRRVYKSLKPLEFETTSAIRADLQKIIEVSGEVQAGESVDLHFQAIGKLTWIGVKEGDSVNKWQAVASQDKRTLEKQLKQDLIAFEKEFRDFDQAVEDNPLINLSFKRILEKAQFDLDSEVIDVEIRNLAIELSTLVTPIEGIVTSVDTPIAGVNVKATDTITIVNPVTLYFEAQVDETDIALMEEGNKATIILDAYEDTRIESAVTWIDFTASTSEGGGTVFLIKLTLPNLSEVNYRQGLNGDVTIIVEEKEEIVVLPLDAVDKDDEGAFVIVAKDGKLEKQSVSTGLETEDDIEIISGLEEGDQVVLPGSIEGEIDVRELRRGAPVLRGG